MSHYDCVLPVDFERLSLELMPAWLDLIAGKRDPREFAEEFAPWQVGVADREFWNEDNWLEPFNLAPKCIEWFRNHEMTEWETDFIRAQLGGLLTDKSSAWCADDLLILAIKQSCAVELPGVNHFVEPSMLHPYDWTRFYARLHELPFIQVVGNKNKFDFLDELYFVSWDSYRHYYSFVRKGIVSALSYELLEKLFLCLRAFPGTFLSRKSFVWPTGDEPKLTGFLSPAETRDLAAKIAEMDAVLVDIEHKPFAFDLFADRLERAASCGAGLVTLFGGL